MKKLMIPVGAMTAFLLFSSFAVAQYQGPRVNPTEVTVVEALESKGDVQLVMEGYIINNIKEDNYTFQDKTGTIVVEIDTRDFGNHTIDDKTLVRVTGEVEPSLIGQPEFEVDFLEVVTPKK